MPPPLLPAFLAHVARHSLFPAGSRVIVAVSGGADSTCLLHLLLAARERLGIGIEVAHFNHRLRGRQADRDAAAVAATARRLELPCHVGRGRAFTPAERRAASTQELARTLRLGFLLRLARRRRAVVALAHTADDQAETVLMRLLTEGGPAALGGIAPASHEGRLVHPLLFARREQIEGWLGERGVRWRNDRTNRSRRYLRNRLRLDLLPVLARGYNPAIVERLCTLARSLRRDNDRLAIEAADLLAASAPGPGRCLLTPEVLATTHPAVLSRVVLAALRAAARQPADFGSRHVETLLAPGCGARAWTLPGGVAASRDGAGLRIGPAAGASPPAALRPTALSVPGRIELPDGLVLSAEVLDRPRGFDPRRFGADPRRVAVDLERVSPPLVVRGRVPGERFQPLGLAVPKRLQDFFVDAGVPAGRRALVPLVCDRDAIVWVAGVRPAEPCRVGAGTRRLLVLTLEPRSMRVVQAAEKHPAAISRPPKPLTGRSRSTASRAGGGVTAAKPRQRGAKPPYGSARGRYEQPRDVPGR